MRYCADCFDAEQDHEGKFVKIDSGEYLCDNCLTDRLREAGRQYRILADAFYRKGDGNARQ
jgi:hypothetical protein